MDDIKNIIDGELDKINPSLNSNNEETINKMIKGLNKGVLRSQYKNDLLEILDKIKKLGYDVSYNKEMSIEELEKIINSIDI